MAGGAALPGALSLNCHFQKTFAKAWNRPAMIAKIIEACVRNRLLVVLTWIIITVGGIYATYNLPVDAIPDLSDVQVIISTEFPGQAPQVVEDQVTYPLTTAMLGVPGAKVVRGFSLFGTSLVYIIFEDGTDIYWARSRVLEYLNFVRGKLPAGVNPALGPDATGVGWIFEYVLEDPTGKHDLAQLRSIQDWYLRYQLQTVPGVAEVASIGGFVKQYQIVVDPNKLAAYGITLGQIKKAVQMSNQDVGGRVVEQAETEYMVRGLGYIKNLADVENIVVGNDGRGTPIFIKDIALVRLGPEMRRGLTEANGEGEVVGGIVVMRFGENARAVLQRVKQKLEDLKAGLPPGVQIVTAYDRSGLIERAIATLKRSHHRRNCHCGVDHRALSAAPPERLRGHHQPAPGGSGLVYPAVSVQHHRQHPEPGRHRHRHRRHGGRLGGHGGGRPQKAGARPSRRRPAAHYPGGRQRGGAVPLFRPPGDHRLLSPHLRPHRRVRPALQTPGLHQDLRHGRGRHPGHHPDSHPDDLSDPGAHPP